MPVSKFVSGLKVDVDITPKWWFQFGGKELGVDRDDIALMISRAMLLAMRSFGDFPACEIVVSRRHLRMQLMIAEGTTMERLAELTSRVTDRLNEMPTPRADGTWK